MPNTAVITFGRFNPLTVGHEKLVNTVKRVAFEQNGTPLVYLSHSHDNKRNPIPYLMKYSLARTAFGSCVVRSDAKTIMSVVAELDKDYENIIFVGDCERSEQMLRLMNKYNGVEYNFNSIQTVSAGGRNTTEYVDAISATKMRKYVSQNDYNSFVAGLATNLKPYGRVVYELVRKGTENAN